jgi:hypothetical protein
MNRLFPVVLILLAAVPASAFAQTERRLERDRDRGGAVAEARKGHGATRPADKVAGGAVSVEPTEGLASFQKTVRITLAANADPVDLDFPGRFSQRAVNGRLFVKGRPTGRHLGLEDRSYDIDVSGLPAGTYRIPVRRAGRTIGTAVFRLYTRRREGGDEERVREAAKGPFGPIGRVPVDSSQDATEESETFIAATPVAPDLAHQRVVAFANDIGPSTGLQGLNVSDDGGATWAHPSFPTTFDTKGGTIPEEQVPSGDPILAADENGNVWAGGLSTCATGPLPVGVGTHSQIFVNRLAPGQDTYASPTNVAIPFLNEADCNAIQDKPQMTIDTGPTSPTRGRIYVTWDDPDPSGGTNEVVAYCDTRPGGTLNAANCDEANNWTNPAIFSDAVGGGSFITNDPAVGPDGKVYVSWWDFSGTNAIEMDMCDPAAHAGHCDSAADWGTDKVLASLTTHNGQIVPFACPTLAQPGGRAAPVQSLAVDHASKRIYAAWSDLGTSGSSRCSDAAAPTRNQDTFKSYVASAPDFATLTANPATRSFERGTNIIDAPDADNWFPWVAVDQSTGQAWVDLYTTKDDSTRKTSRFYERAVVPGAGSTRVSYGPLHEVSTDASDYSDTDPCCQFQNDYGDYTGLDAANGSVFAVWTHRLAGGDGDAFVDVSQPTASPTEVPGDDGIPVVTQPPPTTTTDTTPPPTTTTTTTLPPPPPPPGLQLKYAFGKKADRKGRLTLTLQPTRKAAAGTATLRLVKGNRKLASGLLATSGTKPLKLVLKLKRKDLLTLRRKHSLKVKLSISLTDITGKSKHSSVTFTLRPGR